MTALGDLVRNAPMKSNQDCTRISDRSAIEDYVAALVDLIRTTQVDLTGVHL
jgi:hypothetical protein